MSGPSREVSEDGILSLLIMLATMSRKAFDHAPKRERSLILDTTIDQIPLQKKQPPIPVNQTKWTAHPAIKTPHKPKNKEGACNRERERERKRVFRPAELLARRGKQGAKECSAQPAGLFQGMLQQAGVDATFHQIQRLGQGFSLKNEEHRENKKVMIVAQ